MYSKSAVTKSQQELVRKGEEFLGEKMNFKAWLALNNIKQLEVARFLGISNTEIYNKMHGKSNFTLEQIKKLHDKYGVSADIFLVDML